MITLGIFSALCCVQTSFGMYRLSRAATPLLSKHGNLLKLVHSQARTMMTLQIPQAASGQNLQLTANNPTVTTFLWPNHSSLSKWHMLSLMSQSPQRNFSGKSIKAKVKDFFKETDEFRRFAKEYHGDELNEFKTLLVIVGFTIALDIFLYDDNLQLIMSFLHHLMGRPDEYDLQNFKKLLKEIASNNDMHAFLQSRDVDCKLLNRVTKKSVKLIDTLNNQLTHFNQRIQQSKPKDLYQQINYLKHWKEHMWSVLFSDETVKATIDFYADLIDVRSTYEGLKISIRAAEQQLDDQIEESRHKKSIKELKEKIKVIEAIRNSTKPQ